MDFTCRIFPYKDRIYDSVFIREKIGQRKPVFWRKFKQYFIFW